MNSHIVGGKYYPFPSPMVTRAAARAPLSRASLTRSRSRSTLAGLAPLEIPRPKPSPKRRRSASACPVTSDCITRRSKPTSVVCSVSSTLLWMSRRITTRVSSEGRAAVSSSHFLSEQIGFEICVCSLVSTTDCGRTKPRQRPRRGKSGSLPPSPTPPRYAGFSYAWFAVDTGRHGR